MKPPQGERRVVFNLDEHTWELMKQAQVANDLPQGHWLRAAVREKLQRDSEDDGY